MLVDLKIFSMEGVSTRRDPMRLSAMRTIPLRNLSPAVVFPRVTATRAYSTWNRRQSGLKTVIALSYAIWPGCTEDTFRTRLRRGSHLNLLTRFPRFRLQVLPPCAADRPRGPERLDRDGLAPDGG